MLIHEIVILYNKQGQGARNIFLHLRKLSRNWGQFSSTALVQSNIRRKKVSITSASLQN